MATKRKTSATKTAAKPGRKPRNANSQKADESPQAIAQAVGQALGRTLADLMTGNPPAAAVSLWTVDRRTIGGGDVLECAKQQAMPEDDVKMNSAGLPFGRQTGEALMRVMAAVEDAEQLANRAEKRLSPVLTPTPAPLCAAKVLGDAAPTWGTISQLLHEIADRLSSINNRQADMIDRLEI